MMKSNLRSVTVWYLTILATSFIVNGLSHKGSKSIDAYSSSSSKSSKSSKSTDSQSMQTSGQLITNEESVTDCILYQCDAGEYLPAFTIQHSDTYTICVQTDDDVEGFALMKTGSDGSTIWFKYRDTMKETITAYTLTDINDTEHIRLQTNSNEFELFVYKNSSNVTDTFSIRCLSETEMEAVTDGMDSQSLTVSEGPNDENETFEVLVYILAASTIIASIVACIGWICYCKRNKRRNNKRKNNKK